MEQGKQRPFRPYLNLHHFLQFAYNPLPPVELRNSHHQLIQKQKVRYLLKIVQ